MHIGVKCFVGGSDLGKDASVPGKRMIGLKCFVGSCVFCKDDFVLRKRMIVVRCRSLLIHDNSICEMNDRGDVFGFEIVVKRRWSWTIESYLVFIFGKVCLGHAESSRSKGMRFW